MRSEMPKNADGSAVMPNFLPFITNVVNCTANVPIFTYCAPVAAAGGCPNLFGLGTSALPFPRNTRNVLIRLQVQTRNRDPQTGLFQIVEIFGSAERINPDF
jgi:hypothetical protein